MAKRSLNILKSWFVNGAKPPQEQFWDWIDSFFHKDDTIGINNVNNLQNTLNELALKIELDTYQQGVLQAYNANATYNIPAGYVLEQLIVNYGAPGTLKSSIVSMGDEDIYPEADMSAGWNDPIVINKFFSVQTPLYLAGIPNGSKIVFLIRKIKMA